MSSKPKPVQLPNQQTTANTFGFQSLPDTPDVQNFRDAPTDVDPGVARRGDLRLQAMENRWNSAFTSGLPMHLKMALQESQRRGIQEQNAGEAQQAVYQRNILELGKRERLLPQLVQTGGTSSGYTSQLDQRPGFWSSLAGGLGAGLGSAVKIPMGGGFI